MKKTALMILSAVVLVFGLVSNSMAALVTYNEVYTPGSDFLMETGSASNSSHSWNFDITDNPGWDIPGQNFRDGTISLFLEDDESDGAEKASFTFDGGSGVVNKNINANHWSGLFEVDYTQFSDGIIEATLTATKGDFYFRTATLDVISEYTPVPVPASIILLGSGIFGLIGIKRRQR